MNIAIGRHHEDASKRGWQYRLHLDAPLLFSLIAVCAYGLTVLYSAGGGSIEIVERQLVRLGIAFTCMFLVAQVPPRLLQRLTPWAFVIGVLFLLAVLIAGETSGGAQRWLNLYVVRFQPSEIMKLAVPMMVAWYLADSRLPPDRWQLLTAAILIAVPMLMIAKQPDLGTALLIASSGFFVLFLAGLQWRLMAFCSVLVTAAMPVIWHFMHDYQRQRVITLLNPESDPLGSGYHIIQSKIAIGSGGLFGKGWLNGTQSQLDFLPERSTDFIFAVLGEEFGFLGIALLFAFYAIIVVRSMYDSHPGAGHLHAPAGRQPVDGLLRVFHRQHRHGDRTAAGGRVPLPMVSYGGTSIVTLMIGFGILMSVQTHRKLLATWAGVCV